MSKNALSEKYESPRTSPPGFPWGPAAFLLLILFSSSERGLAASSVAQSFTFQGQLFNAAGTSPLTDTVSLTLGIYSPAGTCLLYEETHTGIDLSLTTGLFSVDLGSATGDAKRTGNDPALSMSQIFSNIGSAIRAPASANCAPGYTPSSGDTRALRVTVTPSVGAPVTLSPDQTLDSVPQAMIAETLQGLTPLSFLQITGAVSTYSVAKASLDKIFGTGGVVDASSLHTHDSLYVQLGSASSQNIGSGGFYSSGTVGVGMSSVPAGIQLQVVSGSAATVGQVIKATAGQTADLFQIRDSSNTVLSKFDASGDLILRADPSAALGAATKQYVDNASWLTSGKVTTALGYTPVNKAGDTMTGLLVLSADPAANLGAATKQYVDTAVGSYIKKDGSVALTAHWDVGAKKLQNLTDPAAAQDAATKAYVDTAVAGASSGIAGASNLTTVGAVPYVSASGTLNQDAADFFWDETNNRLGIGTNTPGSALDVKGTLRLSGATSGYVGLASPAAPAANITYTLPSNDGTNGQVLSTNGSGVLSWTTAASGSVTSVSGTAPIVSSGGATPAISITQSTTTTNGYLSSTDWNTFDGKVGGKANLTNANAITKVTSAGTITEATGLSYTTAANVNQLTVQAGSSQSTNSVQRWLASDGSTVLYSLEGAGSPTATTDLVTKAYVTTAVAAATDSSKVAKNGDTMTGLLVLSADPSAALGAATKQYVDTGLATKQASLGYTPVNKAGDTAVGSLALSAQKTFGLGTYTNAEETTLTGGLVAGDAGKTWFNSQTNQVKYWDGSAAQALGVSGAGLTSLNGQSGGTQTFATPGTSGTAPAWSSAANAHTLNIPMASSATVTAGLLSNTDYSTFDGKVGGKSNLTNVNAITKVTSAGTITEATGLSYTTAANVNLLTVQAGSSQSTGALQKWVASDGSTVLYGLEGSGTPTASTDLVTKGYVTTAVAAATDSSKVAKNGDTMTGLLVLSADPSANLGAATKQYVDNSLGSYLKKDGSVALTAHWDVGAKKLQNLTDPASAQDAATKAYVDTADAGKVAGASNLTTAGAVPYVSASGTLNQDAADFFWDATNNRLGIGTATPVSRFHVGVAPTASANYGLVSLGSGAFDGATAGYFVGHASGTVHAINAASGYGGSLVDYQVAGVSKFKVTATGAVTATSFVGDGSGLTGLSGALSGLTSGGVPYATSATAIATDASNFYWDVTNHRLGIGTTGPSSALHVVGEITSPGAGGATSEHFGLSSAAAGSFSAAFGNGASSSGSASVSVGRASSSAGTSAVAVGQGANAAGTDSIAIGDSASATNSNKNIAIGKSSTASGGYSTAIGDGATASGVVSSAFGRAANATHNFSIAFQNASTTAAHQFVAGSDGTNHYEITDVYIGTGVTDSSPQAVTYHGSGGSGTNIAGANLQLAGGIATGNAGGGDVVFQTSDAGASGTSAQSLTTKMILKASGRVGIGSTSPTQALDVNGTVKATAFSGDGSALTGITATDSTKVAKGGDTMTGLLVLSADPSAALGAATKQYVDTADAGKVAGASNLTTAGAVPYVSASGTLNQDAADFFWDATNNRLGIGTNTPGSSLDVKGTIRLSGATSGYVGLASPAAPAANIVYTLPSNDGSNGQVLSTNGSGTLSWATAASGTVTSVSGTAPIVSSGGTTPAISITQSTTSTNGYLSSTDWNTFDGKVGGKSNLSNANAITKVTSAGTITEATGLSYTTAANVNLLTVQAGSSQSTNALQKWVASDGSTVLYGLRGDGTPSSTTDLVTKTYADTLASGKVAGASNLTTAGALPYVSSSGTLNQDATNLFWDVTNHRLGIGTSSPVSRLHVAVAPTASANYGLVSLGSGAFDGSTSGFFAGSSNGTVHAINAASGYTGSLADYQVAGSSKFKVTATGAVTATSFSGDGSGLTGITATDSTKVAGASNLTTAGAVPYVSASGTVNQDATYFFWDSTNHRLGVGTNSPSSRLAVSNSSNSTSVTGDVGMRIQNTDTTNNNVSTLRFSSIDDSALPMTGASIAGQFTNHSNGSTAGELAFATATGGSLSERMRITSAGRVGIGTTSPSATFHAVSGTASVDPAFKLDFPGWTGSNYSTGLKISATDSSNGAFAQHLLFSNPVYNTTGAIFTANNNGMYFSPNNNGGATDARFIFRDGNSGNTAYISTVASEATMKLVNLYANKTGLEINGATSQSADLIQWKNSGGTTLGVVDASGNMAIGTTSTSRTLTVYGGNIENRVSNTAGAQYGMFVAPDSASLASNGYWGGSNWKTIQAGKGSVIQADATGSGYALAVYADNTSRAADAAHTWSALMVVQMAGNVGIGTGSPGYKLQVGAAADGSEARANAWNTLSDERLKEQFTPIENPLEKLLSIQGYTYYWKSGPDHSRKIGVKAQDVEKAFPEAVSHGKDGYLSVSYNHLVAPVIEAIRELYSKVTSSEAKLAALESENQKIKAENEQLKRRMDALESKVSQALDRAPASSSVKNSNR